MRASKSSTHNWNCRAGFKDGGFEPQQCRHIMVSSVLGEQANDMIDFDGLVFVQGHSTRSGTPTMTSDTEGEQQPHWSRPSFLRGGSRS